MASKWLASAWVLASIASACGDDAGPEHTSDTTVATEVEVTPDITTEVAEDVVAVTPLPSVNAPLELTPGDGTGDVRVQPTLAWSKTDPSRLAVAWTGESNVDGEGLGVVLGIWDVDGDGARQVRAPRLLNTDRAGLRNEPAVCGLASGGFVVVWSVDTQSGSDNLRVAFRRVDAEGAPRDDEDHVVTTDRPGNHWLAEVGCRPENGFVLVGVRAAATQGVGFEVFAQRIGDNGAPDAPVFAPFVRTAGGEVFPVVGVDQRDDLWIAWEDTAAANAITTISARHFSGDTGLPLVEVVSGDVDAQAALVAVDPQGHALLGGVIGTKLKLGVIAPGSPIEPVVLPDVTGVTTVAAAAALANDRFAVVYFRGTGSAVDARFGVIDDGAFGPATTLGSGSFPLAYRPALAASGDNVAVAWTESIGAGAYGVRVSAFRVSP